MKLIRRHNYSHGINKIWQTKRLGYLVHILRMNVSVKLNY